MTVEERLQDICNRTGLSERVVRSVLKAETDSVIDSLKKGETATLIGRCHFKPTRKTILKVGGKLGHCIRVSTKASTKLENTLKEMDDFVEESNVIQLKRVEDLEPSVAINQIKELV